MVLVLGHPPLVTHSDLNPHPACRVLINDGAAPMGPVRLRRGQADL